MGKRAKCVCGEILNIPDSYAEPKIRCPKCERSFNLTRSKTGKPIAPQSMATQPPAPKTAAVNIEPGGEGPDSQAEPCPGCGEPFPSNKMVCAHCSYSRRLKKKIKGRDLTALVEKGKSKKSDKPVKVKVKRKSSEPWTMGEGLEKLIGSIALTLFAVIWLCGGLVMGYLFYFPVILLVIGLLGILFSCGSIIMQRLGK